MANFYRPTARVIVTEGPVRRHFQGDAGGDLGGISLSPICQLDPAG